MEQTGGGEGGEGVEIIGEERKESALLIKSSKSETEVDVCDGRNLRPREQNVSIGWECCRLFLNLTSSFSSTT